MNYSDNPGHCRVDFFMASGRWYTTEVIDMSGLYNEKSLYRAVALAINKQITTDTGHIRMAGMVAIVLEPYHVNAFPIMLKVDDIDRYIHSAPLSNTSE